MRGITTDKKISKYYKQIYSNKLVNLNEKEKLKVKNTNHQNVWKHK